MHQSRFAAARWPHNRYKFPLVDGKAQVMQDGRRHSVAPVSFFKIGNFYQIHRLLFDISDYFLAFFQPGDNFHQAAIGL